MTKPHECPYLKDNPYPAQDPAEHASWEGVMYYQNGKFYGESLADFLKQHDCHKCPKNKKATHPD